MTLNANQLNFSAIPFYKSASERNAERWWIYNIFPLYAGNRTLLPFQIIRGHRTEMVVQPSQKFVGGYISGSGEVNLSGGGSLDILGEYYPHQFTDGKVHISGSEYNGNGAPSGEWLMVFVDGQGNTFITEEVDDANIAWSQGDYSVEIDIPAEADSLYIATNVDGLVQTGTVAKATIFKEDGTQEGSPIDLSIVANAVTGFDVLQSPSFSLNLSQGRHYIKVSDGVEEWISDIITVVPEDFLSAGYVKIEWYDNSDFVMDAGVISYQNDWKNIVYLPAEIAKPSYEFEDEGENRDGYFFPVKIISEKKYRFVSTACEYLLDVLRLVRLADHITIYYRGKTYLVDEFLMTPNWESDGDVAVVEFEFQTDTIAKKI